jgi:triphosphoribosyl-dephospho-CoA synthase
MTALSHRSLAQPITDLSWIGEVACACLQQEAATYPKPGLVSHVDSGAHRDMDCAMLIRSALALAPYFGELAVAGGRGATMNQLRIIGIAAEAAMLEATAGTNTHRGAIFGLGLLCAAAGARVAFGLTQSLGELVAERWGEAVLAGPIPLHSHGAVAGRRYGAGGARLEASLGSPSVYTIALPALQIGRCLVPNDEEAARVQACMTLIANVTDTNLLHRGGPDGLVFAQTQTRAFLAAGGVGQRDWRAHAATIHLAFAERNLSPGGCADLLAMALFVDQMER